MEVTTASNLVSGEVSTEWKLSPSEQRVYDLVITGITNKEVAAKLFVTEKTVKFHMTAILKKTGAQRRTELIAKALSVKTSTT